MICLLKNLLVLALLLCLLETVSAQWGYGPMYGGYGMGGMGPWGWRRRMMMGYNPYMYGGWGK